jgi:hypothetical protein
MKLHSAFPFSTPRPTSAEPPPHRREIVAHLREFRPELCAELADRLRHARWLGIVSEEETFAEAAAIYDEYVAALETGRIEALQDCSSHVSDRLMAGGVDVERILGVVRFLRYLVMRSLFDRFYQRPGRGAAAAESGRFAGAPRGPA